MRRYKIKITKEWSFKLDGVNKEQIEGKIRNILYDSQILDLPEVNKKIKWKVKKINRKGLDNND